MSVSLELPYLVVGSRTTFKVRAIYVDGTPIDLTSATMTMRYHSNGGPSKEVVGAAIGDPTDGWASAKLPIANAGTFSGLYAQGVFVYEWHLVDNLDADHKWTGSGKITRRVRARLPAPV